MQTALDAFFEHAWRSANASLQTSKEALVAINNVTWFDGYKPGHDEVTLRYDEASGRYTIDVKEVRLRAAELGCCLLVRDCCLSLGEEEEPPLVGWVF